MSPARRRLAAVFGAFASLAIIGYAALEWGSDPPPPLAHTLLQPAQPPRVADLSAAIPEALVRPGPIAPGALAARVGVPSEPVMEDAARLAPTEVVPLGEALPPPWAAAPAWTVGDQPPVVSAAAVVVMDEASGAVLYSYGAHERRAPASLTKMATAILAAERGDLDALVVSDVDAFAMPGSSLMGLHLGDEFTLRDLLFGLMLPSGNDAALAIARHVSGSDQAFAEEMTNLARRLGLRDTRFTNPHGLTSRGHYSSAYDLAVMARYLMSIPTLREVVAAPSWLADGSRNIVMRNVNPLLHSYPGADGVKTGFTRTAGKTFVGSVTQDGHRVYVVLLNAPDREADAVALFDWVFDAYVWPEAEMTADATGPTIG